MITLLLVLDAVVFQEAAVVLDVVAIHVVEAV
jgi:hypothetical protein